MKHLRSFPKTWWHLNLCYKNGISSFCCSFCLSLKFLTLSHLKYDLDQDSGRELCKGWPGVQGHTLQISCEITISRQLVVNLRTWSGVCALTLQINYPGPSSCTLPPCYFLRWLKINKCQSSAVRGALTSPALPCCTLTGRGNCSTAQGRQRNPVVLTAFPPASDPRHWCHGQPSE